MRRILASALAVCLVTCSGRSNLPSLDIATTTSVVNSGLLDAILPQFHDHTVRVHAAGSGRSLAMLADGTVALVISHAPVAEQESLWAHPNWRYQKLAYNRFVLVGPKADPASVRSGTSAVDALKRIATNGAPFISRGDSSGTHERETTLWKLAGATPQGLVSGAGMAVTLRQADSRGAYTLTDEATWRQLQGDLDGLSVVFENDPTLLNTYAVIYAGENRQAATLSNWLTTGQGRELIAAFKIGDRAGFTVWPVDCPGQTPSAQLCRNLGL